MVLPCWTRGGKAWIIRSHRWDKTRDDGAFNAGCEHIQQTSAYQENLLCDTIDRMRRNPEGRKMVHLHLSRLMPSSRTPVKTKIVSRMFGDLESGMHVQMFPMINQDLTMTVAAGAQRDVNTICNRIRALFDEDPITFTEDSAGNNQFVTWYDLEVDSA